MDSPASSVAGFKPSKAAASIASSGAGAPAAAKRGPGRPPLSEDEKAKRAAIKEAAKAAAKAEKEAAKAAAKAEKEAAKAAAKAAKAAAPKPPKAAAGAGTGTASVASTESTPKPVLEAVLPEDPVAANKALIAELSALRRRYAALETVYQKEHAALSAIRATIAGC